MDEDYHRTFHTRWHFVFCSSEVFWWELCLCQGRSRLDEVKSEEKKYMFYAMNMDMKYGYILIINIYTLNPYYQHSDKIRLVRIGPKLPLPWLYPYYQHIHYTSMILITNSLTKLDWCEYVQNSPFSICGNISKKFSTREGFRTP